ncbi:hypothetical protein CVT25_012868 [Psilocybe cyanescens]|uniref:Uncharacterized protein n=1 Tax=Psilocybe cyanescens TaxID=93625 RepID=A0A409XLX1_PSICY|nr:hypothetical protein CVT25_012868 [Psilocybe cyanescens]
MPRRKLGFWLSHRGENEICVANDFPTISLPFWSIAIGGLDGACSDGDMIYTKSLHPDTAPPPPWTALAHGGGPAEEHRASDVHKGIRSFIVHSQLTPKKPSQKRQLLPLKPTCNKVKASRNRETQALVGCAGEMLEISLRFYGSRKLTVMVMMASFLAFLREHYPKILNKAAI